MRDIVDCYLRGKLSPDESHEAPTKQKQALSGAGAPADVAAPEQKQLVQAEVVLLIDALA